MGNKLTAAFMVYTGIATISLVYVCKQFDLQYNPPFGLGFAPGIESQYKNLFDKNRINQYAPRPTAAEKASLLFQKPSFAGGLEADQKIEKFSLENQVNILEFYVDHLTLRDYYKGKSQDYRCLDQGNGFFINNKGYVITSKHVVDKEFFDLSKVLVVDQDKNTYEATILAVSDESDLALLRTDRGRETALSVSLRADVKPNEKIYCLSKNMEGRKLLQWKKKKVRLDKNRFQVNTIISSGKVMSYKDTPLLMSGSGLKEWIKTTEFTKAGHSGSAVLDRFGNVVGVKSGGSETTTAITPSKYIRELVELYKKR